MYDWILLFSVIFMFTLFVVAFGQGGQAISPDNLAYRFFLALICVLYYCWHWVGGRQTLGMRAWRLHARRRDGKPLAWTDAARRCASAALLCLPGGAGWIGGLFRRDRQCLHDRMSGTFLWKQD